MKDLTIILLVVLIIDYIDYRYGGNAIFFKDRTELEKNRRELQHLKIKFELQELKSKLPQEESHDE